MGNHATTHPEIERKFEGRPRTDLELKHVRGVTAVVELEPKRLRATYFDTPDLRLAALGLTLRERSGGDDAGWHLKVPAAQDEKIEMRVTRRDAGDGVPEVLARDVRALTRDVELVPVMRIRTERREHEALNRENRVLAVVAWDEVIAEPLLTSRGAVTWSEREVELVEGDEALLDRIARLLARSGLRSSDWPSKLAHALAATSLVPDHPDFALAQATAGAVVLAHLREQVHRLELHDVGVRCDQPDAVHQMRVATRRLRSALATFRPLLAGPRWEQARAELKWLGEGLGRARDVEVMRARLDQEVARLPVELLLGPVKPRIERTLRDEESAALDVVRRELDGERYLRLLDELESLVADPPFTKRARRVARRALPKQVRHAGRRVDRADRADRQVGCGEADRSDAQLHEIRKAAKRARYAAEAAEPALGKRARRMARRNEALQDLLGEHQDSVNARALLRQLGAQAHPAGQNGYTFGLLYGLEECRAAAVRADYAAVMRAAANATSRI